MFSVEKLLEELQRPLVIVIGVILLAIFVKWLVSARRERRARRALGQIRVQLEGIQEELAFISKTAEALSSVLNKEQLLRLILENLLKLAGSEYGFLLLNDYARGQFVYETGFGIDRTMLQKTAYGTREGIIGEAVKAGKVKFSEPVDGKDEFLKEAKRDSLVAGRHGACFPLFVEGEPGAVAIVYCAPATRQYLEVETGLVAAVSATAAIALGSAIQCELAILDRLTRVYNHDYFQQRLHEEIEKSRRYRRPLSLLMADIDHFKPVNDNYGHQVGDEVLRRLATVVTHEIRLVDLCGRYGGEEFAVLLPDTEQEGGVRVAERMRAAVEAEQFDVGRGNVLKITMSIGVASWEWPHGEKVDRAELVRRADEQLYRAKRDGRNRVCAHGAEAA